MDLGANPTRSADFSRDNSSRRLSAAFGSRCEIFGGAANSTPEILGSARGARKSQAAKATKSRGSLRQPINAARFHRRRHRAAAVYTPAVWFIA